MELSRRDWKNAFRKSNKFFIFFYFCKYFFKYADQRFFMDTEIPLIERYFTHEDNKCRFASNGTIETFLKNSPYIKLLNECLNIEIKEAINLQFFNSLYLNNIIYRSLEQFR